LQPIGLDCQSRLVSSRRVLVENTLLNRLVDGGDGQGQKSQGLGGFSLRQQSPQLFDLRAQSGPIGGVDLIATGILPIPFLG
jgi:hypothetical protein